MAVKDPKDSITNILIVGGGAGGISLAHYLLRKSLPQLSAQLRIEYKLTLLSPSPYFYWKVGAPRGLVNPSLISLAESFIPIEGGFRAFDSSRFELISATATGLDATRRVLTAVSESGSSLEVKYDALVIATGAASNSPLYSLSTSPGATKSALEAMHAKIPEAKTVVIAGGGPAGTETAGEFGAEFGMTKEIILISGHQRLLPRLSDKTGAEAERQLSRLGVKIIHGTRVKSTTPPTEAGHGPTEVCLDNGMQLRADVFVDATGCSPSTSFLPPEWLDDRGYVATEVSTLRLAVGGIRHVYALGSVASFSNGSFFDVLDAVPALADSIRLDQMAAVAETAETEKNASDGWWRYLLLFVSDPAKRRFTYVPRPGEIQFIPCGREGGVGEFYRWRLPSLAIYHIKAKTFMIESARPLVEGTSYK